MKLFIKLAWRNAWRNRRRSIITIAAVGFASFLTIVFEGMNFGTYEANIKTSCEMFSGYLQVQKKGFQDNPSLNKSFKLNRALESKLRNIHLIKNLAPRILSDGLVGYKDNTFGVAIFGIDPTREREVSKIHERLKEGKFISEDAKNEVVIGYRMLKNLKAEIGDTIVVLSSCFDGTMGNKKFKIRGTSKMGSAEIDAASLFMHIEAADELLALNGRISTVVVSMNRLKDIPKAKKQTAGILPTGLEVLDWGEVTPELKQTMEMDTRSNAIFAFILIIIVSFGILNTVLMSITERFREFGVMLAIGIRNRGLTVIVFMEMIFIILVGLFFGNALGWAVNFYIKMYPIKLGGQMGQFYEEFGFIPAIYSTVEPFLFIYTSLTVFLISVFIFIYPALRLKNLEALKGIRYT